MVDHRLLVEVEDDNLDVLLRDSEADELNCELLIWPVLTGEAIEDGTGVAVIFLQSLGEHALKQLLGQVLELSRIELFILIFLALLSLLLFLSLSNCFLKLYLLLFEVFDGFITHGVATLLPEVNQLVHSDEASLVFLCKEVGSGGASTAFWTHENHVKPLFFLQGRWHLDLKLISEHLCKLRLKGTLQGGQVVPRLGDFLLSLLRLFELRPIFAVLILRVLLAVFFSLSVLCDFLLECIVFLDLMLCSFDFTLESLNPALVIILLFDGGPELSTWLTQGQEEGLT